MRKTAVAALLLLAVTPAWAQEPYHILRTVTVGGDGGFDYVTVDSKGRRLYVARSGKTNQRLLAFDLDSLKQTGELDGINAHGAVVDEASRHGFASSKPIAMFDPISLALLKSIAVEGNPDGMTSDPAEGRVYVLSHSTPNITAINAADGTVLGALDIEAAPEETAADGKGHLYVALENKGAVGVVETRSLSVTARYPLAGTCGTPAGLAMDVKNQILFVACRNPAVMVMVNALNGAILQAIPIGIGNDGVVFNPATGEAIASQGEGTLVIIKQQGPGHFVLEQTLSTLPGAKTLALDAKSGHIFLITADYGPVPADAQPPSNGRIARGPMLADSFKILEIGR